MAVGCRLVNKHLGNIVYNNQQVNSTNPAGLETKTNIWYSATLKCGKHLHWLASCETEKKFLPPNCKAKI